MSDDLALAPKSLDEAKSLSKTLSTATLLSADLRGKEADVLLVMMTGREMGLGPMQALRAFDVIKGKVAMKPEAMVATVRSHHSVDWIRCTEATPTKAVWQSKLKGQDYVASTTFTMDDAKAAGLSGQENYRKWPTQMLQWRAASMHCKKNHSDIIMGLYSTEEVQSFDAPTVERDVTPQAKADAIDTTASVSAAKAAVAAVTKRRMNVVDVPPAPAPTPPLEESAPVDPVVTFGPHKGHPISGLSAEELTSTIELGEANVAKEPNAGWVRGVNACLAQLHAEQQQRFSELTATGAA